MKDLILLHGAIGASSQLEPLAAILEAEYTVHLLNLPGHGGTPLPPGGFSMDGFVQTLFDYIQEQQLKQPSIFGYSMGGYVALMLARTYPDSVQQVITLATKFDWSAEIAEKEIAMLQPEVIEKKLPAFAAQLATRHAPVSWKDQLAHTANLLTALGSTDPLRRDPQLIKQPVMLMLGDRDKMVSLDETINFYRKLPNACLTVLPSTPHPIEQIDVEVLSVFIRRFIA